MIGHVIDAGARIQGYFVSNILLLIFNSHFAFI